MKQSEWEIDPYGDWEYPIDPYFLVPDINEHIGNDNGKWFIDTLNVYTWPDTLSPMGTIADTVIIRPWR